MLNERAGKVRERSARLDRTDGDGRAEQERLAGERRVYHFCLGLLEVGMYAVPASFLGQVISGWTGELLAVFISLVAWMAVSAWVMRRAEERFALTRDARSASGSGARLRTDILKYAAVSSLALLAFALVPLPLGLLVPAIGTWIEPSGVGFFCFVGLMVACILYSATGLLNGARRFYPEYPGPAAALLFVLGMVCFFVAVNFGI